ncbi:MAG: AAA family ATPase [Ktedonobacterales bacterium]|nr:AAA family ATPase [Ktedonobacterales bacterium]
MTLPFERPVVCPILVARDDHLAALRQLCERAASGVGHTVLVSGEAGIGKSRLVAEAKGFGAHANMRVLQGNCFEPDRAALYAPLLDLFRGLLATCSRDEIVQDLGAAGPELVKILPELTLYLPDLAPTPALDPEQEKRRLYDALARLFLRLASAQPLLIVIEDLHWCDDTSLGFLLSLARRGVACPLLLLLTYRSDEVHADLRHLLAGLDRERLATEMSLPRLDTPGIETMLRAIFALERPVRADFLEALRTMTEGNPFFIEEILKALVSEGGISYQNGAWDRKPTSELHIPRSLHDAVQRRVQQLSPEAQGVLALAAVAGQRFDFALLQEITGYDERELLRLIKEVIAAQLVVEVSAEQCAFRHALTRQAIYSELLARERQTLHRTLADAIERVYGATPDSHLADLAYHFYEAHMWEKALDYARRVGERSLALYAPRPAVEQFTRALEAARRLALAPLPWLSRGRGRAHETLGDFESARGDYEAALRAASEIGDSQAEWQALLDLGLLWAGRDYMRTGDYYRRASELANEMDDVPARAQSLNCLGNWHLNLNQPLEALRCHGEALALFEGLGARYGVAQTLDLLGMASFLHSDAVQGVVYFERAVAIEREIGELRLLSSSLATLALCVGPSYQTEIMVLAAPDVSQSLAKADEALRLARDIGWRAGEAFASFVLGCHLGTCGVYGPALEAARQALTIAEEIEHRQWAAAVHWALGNVFLDLLALPQARAHLEEGLARARAIGSRHWMGCISGSLALACVALGDLSGAQAVLDAVLPPDAPMRTMGQRLAWRARAAVALARGLPQEAVSLVEALSAATPRVGDGDHHVAHLTRLRGQALAALDQPARAEAELRAALALARKEGRRALVWHCAVDLGHLARGQRHPRAAEEAFGDARQVIEEIAAGLPDDELCRAFVRQATALLPTPASPSPRRAAAEHFAGLTAREREVARLIAQGKSNRAIAEALVLSERTIESHVTNILLKLTFTSRAQIAAWAVRHGLVVPNEP